MKRDVSILLALLMLWSAIGACGSSDFPTSSDLGSGDAEEREDLPDVPDFMIQTLIPARGPVTGQTRIEVLGTGFEAGSRVVFDATEAFDVVVQNATSIMVTTPPHPAGIVTVRVQRPDGRIARSEFLYASEVRIDRVFPDAGPTQGGTPITVRGTGFDASFKLAIGGRAALSLHVVDETTLHAMTPPGIDGPRDLHLVGNMGSTTLRKAYRYVSAPVIESCIPAAIPAGRAVSVTALGPGLDQADSAGVSPGQINAFAPLGKDALELALAPAKPGPIAVTVTTPGGTTTLPDGLWALSSSEAGSTLPRILGLAPSRGSQTGGEIRAAVVAGLGTLEQAQVAVTFDGVPAEVLGISASGHTVSIVVPPHAEGLVDVALRTPAGEDTLAVGYEYLPEVMATTLDPASGPPEGGTPVLILGQHLEQVREVRFGPFAATIAQGPSPWSMVVLTPPSPPGRTTVTLTTAWGVPITLGNYFVYEAPARDLHMVTPDRGAMAGGTLVSILGERLDPGVRVRFGEAEALSIVEAGDPSQIRLKTPPGTPGIVDVTVVWPDGMQLTLPDAYTYFDPTGYFGGTWGESIDGVVNVTVIDSSSSDPLPMAFVILGGDSGTPHKGRTDANGQITFAADDLFGPLEVTTSREDCSTFTLAGADSENITLFLYCPTPSTPGTGGGTGGDPLVPGRVSGRVLGIDKYVLAPPGSCEDRPLIYGSLCRPCASDADCTDGARCLDFGGTGAACATLCDAPTDCPDAYGCYAVSAGGNACLPSPGVAEVRCYTSKEGRNYSRLDPGPGFLVDAAQRYAIASRLGDVAVYCMGGYRSYSDGRFSPLVLGVRRHVAVYSNKETAGQDVRLEVLMDRELAIRLLSAPEGPGQPALHTLSVVLNLGSDGVLDFWPQMQSINGRFFRVGFYPDTSVAALSDATLSLYSEALVSVMDTYPYAASISNDHVRLAAVRNIRVDEGGMALLDADVRADIAGGCADGNGGGFVFGHAGAAWAVDADGAMTALPALGQRTKRACAVLADGSMLAVGDHGSIHRLTGALVQAELSGTGRDLLAVAVNAQGDAVAVGEGILLRRTSGGTWQPLIGAPKNPLRAVTALHDGRFAAVGDAGIGLRVQGDLVTLASPWPATRNLRAAVALADHTVLLAGDAGTVVLWDPDTSVIEDLGLPIAEDLQAAAALSDGTVVVAGARGTVWRHAAGQWKDLGLSSFGGEVSTLIASSGKAFGFCRDVATLGPFVWLPRFTSPRNGGVWDQRTVAWTYDGPDQPSLWSMTLTDNSTMPGWDILASGAISSFRLPDLGMAAGLYPLPGDTQGLYVLGVLLDDFSFDQLDATAINTLTWRSWVVDFLSFGR